MFCESKGKSMVLRLAALIRFEELAGPVPPLWPSQPPQPHLLPAHHRPADPPDRRLRAVGRPTEPTPSIQSRACWGGYRGMAKKTGRLK